MNGSETRPLGARIVHTRVLENRDLEGLGRVMVHVPGFQDPYPAWVATGAAGKDRGMYFIPQPGDEVLVLIKDHPDMSAYVVGCLWTSRDTPPRREPDAAANVQLIRTPGGHEICFDDRTGELIIETPGQQRVSLSKQRVEIRSKQEQGAVITLTNAGKITLSATNIEISATSTLELKGASISLDATGECTIKGARIGLN